MHSPPGMNESGGDALSDDNFPLQGLNRTGLKERTREKNKNQRDNVLRKIKELY